MHGKEQSYEEGFYIKVLLTLKYSNNMCLVSSLNQDTQEIILKNEKKAGGRFRYIATAKGLE